MNRKTTIKVSLIVLAVITVGFGVYRGAALLAPGTYVDTEEYYLHYREAEIKDAIIKFKEEHPEYKVPGIIINGQNSYGLDDSPERNRRDLFIYYFYYREENQVLFTYTKSIEWNNTAFALVSISDGVGLGNWKDINRDFSRSENKEQKKKFEERILKEIKAILNRPHR